MKKFIIIFMFVFIISLTGCDSATLEQFEQLEIDIEAIEDYDDTALLASITALEAELVAIEDYDDTALLAVIASLEAELTALEATIGPVFSNIPRDQVVEWQEYLDLLSLGVTAYDNTDGDLTSSITVSILYTSQLTVGNHAATYTVTDSDGNERSETVNITVQFNHHSFTYLVINENSEIMLTGYKQPTTTHLTVPSTLGGLPVTTIGHYAFIGLELNAVTFNENLVEIQQGAFISNSITTVSFPNSLEIIGINAFSFNNIANATISAGVSLIGISAFKSDSILNYTVADDNPYYKSIDGVLYSKDETILVDFPQARTDTTFVIPEGVIEIGASAFDLSDLVSVTLPSTLQIIGGRAFYYCNLTNIILPEGLITINYFAFRSNELTKITIPSSVVTIGSSAFSENSFTSVTILGVETRFNNIWASSGFPMIYMP